MLIELMIIVVIVGILVIIVYFSYVQYIVCFNWVVVEFFMQEVVVVQECFLFDNCVYVLNLVML